MVDQISMYDLEHNDKKQYISQFDCIRSRRINDPFNPMLDNKVTFYETIKSFCDTPTLYAVKRAGRISGMEGLHICSSGELVELLRREGKYVLKPIVGCKGGGVFVIAYENGVYSSNGKELSENDLLSLLDKERDYLICAFAHQAEYLNEIYAGSANTIRMIVLRDTPEKEFDLAFAVQRIGAGWTGPVDNGSKGGLISNVNIATGELSESRTMHNLSVYNVHPDSGKPIKGVVIPNWDAIKQGVLDASAHFPYLDIIAWDILPTPDGFTVIEGNASSGVNIIQLWGPQRYGRLGKFYRDHGIIK